MNNIFLDYPDIVRIGLIPVIIAIFVLAFPLLIQTISRIDDKYNSTKLIETFRQDWICKWFLGILITAIISCIIWVFQFPFLINGVGLIGNLAFILVAISTIALIVMLFLIIYLIYIYYVPEKLLDRFIRSYNKTNKSSKQTLYFEAISKILFYSINKADEDLTRTLYKFYCEAFVVFRKGKSGQIIEYPQEFYNTFFEANELLCIRKRKTISFSNSGILFDLFLDSFQKTVISSKTYKFLWRVIVQSVLYNKGDFVVAYWRKAHQLFEVSMQQIFPKYRSSRSSIPTNKPEIDKREEERNEFLEFHYALGALLMYQKKYTVLKELMSYKQSDLPSYVLIPERMEQIIERYMQIDNFEYLNSLYYEQKYWFPDIDGVNSDSVIIMWIKRYLAVLFIRQYTLYDYYMYFNRLEMPTPPEKLSELNHWKEELRNLKDSVNDMLKEKNILTALGLEQFCNPNWFTENDKIKPSYLIENYIKEIEKKYNKIKTEQPVDINKKKNFQKTTINHLTPIFEKYSKIFTNNNIGGNYKSYYIDGRYDILDKTPFAENQDISYLNFDSVTAQGVAMQFQKYSLNIFGLMFPQRYLMVEKDLFLAIDRLGINSSDFVIISVGLDIKYFSDLSIDGLKKENEEWSYNGIKIIEIDYRTNIVSKSLFILKKEDLPNMIFKEVDKQFVDKYNLEKIDDKFNIYTAINKLNKKRNKSLKEEFAKQNLSDDLSQMVLACVDINVEIQCKQDIKYVQLKLFFQFNERGKPNSIDEIKKFW